MPWNFEPEIQGCLNSFSAHLGLGLSKIIVATIVTDVSSYSYSGKIC